MVAFMGFGAITGCRQGMAVNCPDDDTSIQWKDLPSLLVGYLHIHEDTFWPTEGKDVAGHLAACRIEVRFQRKKGMYFAVYSFGTALTPDSHEMLRLCTVGMLRLLARTGSFRACYAKLEPATANRLRLVMAHEGRFTGL